MNFGFSEEQEHLRKTVRDVLTECAPMKRVREVMEDSDTSVDPALWQQMAQLGWLGLSFPESSGGADLSLIEQCIVLEELGRVLAPTPFLPTAIKDALFSLFVLRNSWAAREMLELNAPQRPRSDVTMTMRIRSSGRTSRRGWRRPSTRADRFPRTVRNWSA